MCLWFCVAWWRLYKASYNTYWCYISVPRVVGVVGPLFCFTFTRATYDTSTATLVVKHVAITQQYVHEGYVGYVRADKQSLCTLVTKYQVPGIILPSIYGYQYIVV